MSFLATFTSVAGKIAGYTTYRKAFSRYETPQDNECFFLTEDYYLNSLKGASCLYTKELLKFSSDKFKLQGYLYSIKKPKGLVIIAHGLHSCAKEFYSQMLYFLNAGYNVFSYDSTGTGNSDGDWSYGLVQFLIDLDYALSFVEKCKSTKKLNKYLFGHSMGGYACLSILAKHKNIKAVAAISAPNNGYTLIVEKGLQYVDPTLLIGADTIMEIEDKLFSKYKDFNAVKGINSVSCPILIAHSPLDLTIDFMEQSAFAHRSEFINKNVSFYLVSGSQMGHTKILFSKEAIKYQKEVNKNYKMIQKIKGQNIPKEDIKKFVMGINKFKYSELNYELMDLIIDLFNRA